MGSRMKQIPCKEMPAVKQKILLSDIMCPICWDILIEPVTMPCTHELCMPCFKENVQVANFECPLCRRRISTWARSATKSNSLINQKRWEEIQAAFPEKVKKRLAGIEDEITNEEFPPSCDPITEPGEIRKEYERQLKKFQDEEAHERELEAKASEELIKKFQIEEQQVVEKQRSQEEQILLDEILAQQLYYSSVEEPAIVDNMLKELNTDLCDVFARSDTAMELPRSSEGSASASSSRLQSSQLFRSRNATPYTYTQGKENNTSSLRSTSAESHDSITSEMNHFKPITVAPKTPPKRLPDGRLVEPAVVQTKARKLDYSLEESVSEVIANKVQTIIDETDLGADGGGNDTSSDCYIDESPTRYNLATNNLRKMEATDSGTSETCTDCSMMDSPLLHSTCCSASNKPRDVVNKTQGIDLSSIGSSNDTSVDSSLFQSPFVLHSSSYVAATNKPRNLVRKGIDTSFKENYPLYPEADNSIRAGSKATAPTRTSRALTKRSQNQMDKSVDSLCLEDMDISNTDEMVSQRLEQETADREFALRLHNELNAIEVKVVPKVNRMKGSENEYNLRSSCKKRGSRP